MYVTTTSSLQQACFHLLVHVHYFKQKFLFTGIAILIVNFLDLNIIKTKEMIIDFRKKEARTSTCGKNGPKNHIFQNFETKKCVSFSCPKDPSVQKLGS